MLKFKKLCVPLIIALIFMTFFVSLVACTPKDNPNENKGNENSGPLPPEPDNPETIKAKVLELIPKIQTPDNVDFRMYQSDSSYEAQLRVKNSEKFLARSSSYGTEIYGYIDSKPFEMLDSGDRRLWNYTSHYEVNSEFDNTKESVYQYLDILKGLVSGSIPESKLNVSLKDATYSFGEYEDTINFSLNMPMQYIEGILADMSISAELTKDLKLKTLFYDLKPLKEYYPDCYVTPENDSISLYYDYADMNDIDTSNIGEMENIDYSYIYASGADFPESFNHKIPYLVNGNINTVTLPEPLPKENLTFEGWYYDYEFKHPITDNKFELGTSYVYAKWNNPNFTVELNGGTLSEEETANIKYYSNNPHLLVPKKDGYEFKGWYSDENCTQSAHRDMVYDKVYANWSKPVTVTPIAEGIAYKIAPISVSGSYSQARYDLPREVVKKGYLFEGWYLDKEYTKPIDDSTEAITSDFSVYAKFTKGYSVDIVGTSNLNLSYFNIPTTGTVEEFMEIINDKLDMSIIFSHEGKELYGFSYEKNGTDIIAYPTNDTTIYLIYKEPLKINYKIGDNEAKEYSYTVQGNRRVRYNFDYITMNIEVNMSDLDSLHKIYGWYSDPNYTTPIDLEAIPSDAITLYAKVVEKPRYVLEIPDSSPITIWVDDYPNHFTKLSELFGYTDNLSFREDNYYSEPGFVPSGKIFEGWYNNPNYTERTDLSSAIALEGEVKLYAKLINDITLSLRGGTDYTEDDFWYHTGRNDITLSYDYVYNYSELSLYEFVTTYVIEDFYYDDQSSENSKYGSLEGLYTDEACTIPVNQNEIPSENTTWYYKITVNE